MIDEESLDHLADEISDFTPPAPKLESTTNRSSTVESDWKEVELRQREGSLITLDRVLISGGARLILLLPLFAIVLFGVAQSYGENDNQWWDSHLMEASGGLSLVTATYALTLLIIIADIALLSSLLRMMSYSRSIFHQEAESLTSSGITFRSSHGYAEMRATIDGSIRQVTATSSLMIISALLLATSLWLSNDDAGMPILISFSTGSLLAGQGVHLISVSYTHLTLPTSDLV